MAMALAEARKGLGKTAPNPPVGAVVVRAGEVLGSGWHRRAGTAHAEVVAMEATVRRHGAWALDGATVFVTLEPCSTRGRTGACTDRLIEAGIGRVVYGCVDPNPDHAGRADAVLAAAGVEVRAGVLVEDCRRVLRPFSKVQRTGLPWVIWKSAMSLDGKITRPAGEGQWLSGLESRADVQVLRSEVDAILTSGETVRRDRPAMTIRVPELLEGREQPWRVVVSARPETLPMDAPLFVDEWRGRTLLRGGGLEVLLRELVTERGVLSVLVEAGGVMSAEMLAAGLVDEVVVYLAPMLCGGTSPAVAGEGFEKGIKLLDVSYDRLGEDLRMRGLIGGGR